MTDKFNYITQAIRKNRTSLDMFNQTFGDRAESKKKEIIAKFLTEAGCMPSEAELVLEPAPHGDKMALVIHLRRRGTLASPCLPLDD